MKQVLMKRNNQRTGCTDLIRVDVLSETNGQMRVKVPGMHLPIQIEASQTKPCPQFRPQPGMQVPTQAYNFPGSLARDLN